MSRIVTFYSYKGGVGRTMALANIGILLAMRGQRVLLMDWDLEAPGLERYFRPYQTASVSCGQGVVHLLHQAATNRDADWRPHVQSVRVRPKGAQQDTELSLIPSGVASPDYADEVRRFSWDTFLAEQRGGEVLERWRSEWKASFDLVLIDSRTGITDIGGICTILLPDFLVLVFTANDQSFEGTLAIAASAQLERRRLAVQRPPLMFLPLLSRFDRRDEIAEADKWLARFAQELAPLYADWLPTQFDAAQVLEVTKVPYVTRFSFGEPLPVLTHSLTDPELPGYYLDKCARLLASDFSEAARILQVDSQGLAGDLEVVGSYRDILAKARSRGDHRQEAVASLGLGDASLGTGELQQALSWYEAGLRLSRSSGETAITAHAAMKIGLVHTSMGSLAEAISYFELAAALFRAVGDRRGEGKMLANLGNACRGLGQLERAIGYFEQALVIAREIGNVTDQSYNLYNLGNAYAGRGDIEKAIGYYHLALAIARQIGDRRTEANVLGELGAAYKEQGDVEAATACLQASRTIGEEINDPQIVRITSAAS